MLVLSRKKDEKIIIGDQITVLVIEIRGDKVRLGIDAPKEITVHRQEVYEAIQRENAAGKNPDSERRGASHPEYSLSSYDHIGGEYLLDMDVKMSTKGLAARVF